MDASPFASSERCFGVGLYRSAMLEAFSFFYKIRRFGAKSEVEKNFAKIKRPRWTTILMLFWGPFYRISTLQYIFRV